jgi:formyltetrahydrofolate hydrolase
MTPESQERYILSAACRDAIGIVADGTGILAERRLFIAETADFGDAA